jgi:hypothetical protein
MILRRVIAHFRKQEWTAIAIDFLIVVVGVFIGLQVNNWNEGRGEARAEAEMLARVEEEFSALKPRLERSIAAFEETTAATGAVILQLRQGEPPADEPAFRRLLAKSAFLWYVPTLPPVYSELTSTGGLSGLSNKELRGALARYGNAYALYAQIQPQAKAVMTDPRAHYNEAVEWSVDPETWRTDDAIVRYDFARLCEAKSEMQIWQTYQHNIREIAKQQLQEVGAVLAILKDDAP